MSVTVRDVAREAGVSASTVSRALANPDQVHPATRHHIMRVVADLGYVPNRAARGLVTGRTGSLGVIVPDLANPFFASTIKGIQNRAAGADYSVLLADSDETADAEIGLARTLSKQVDGLILCSPRMPKEELAEVVGLSRVVLMHRKARGVPSIVVDNSDGMRQIAVHLVDLGHVEVGHVAGLRESWTGAQRVRAFGTACASVKLHLTDFGHFAPTYEGGLAASDAVRVSRVTAVIASNDMVALGLISGLANHGLSVPEDISVVGIDDIPTSAMTQPPLTSLSVPKREAGLAAVDLLLTSLDDSLPLGALKTPLATRLVIRRSTARLDSTSGPHNRRDNPAS